jgi:prepilin-type N-terminal cleavage/methylation domain-containing protein
VRRGIAFIRKRWRDGIGHVGRFVRNERGVTIPELMISLVIAASVAGLIGTAVYQFFVISSNGNDRLTVLQSLQNAAVWLGRDISEASAATGGTGSVYGTLTTGDPTVEYRYSYDAAGKALVREQLVSGVVQSTHVVARHIENQGDIVFSVSGDLIHVSITATSDDGAVSETKALDLAMRVH